MISTICISTGNQQVNLLPALQLGAEKMYLISSQQAEKQHWTPNLRLVCQRRNIQVQVIPIGSDVEISPDQMAQTILPVLSANEEVYWNISGGKKSMILGMYNAYQNRAHPTDRIIYTENNPYQIIQYRGFQFYDKMPMNVFLDLEDVLNLFGFTSGNTGTRLDQEDFPEWVSFVSQYYKTHRLFQELIARCFAPHTEEHRDKEPLRNVVRRILNENRLVFDDLISLTPDFDDNAKGNIAKKVKAYCEKSDPDLAPILDACNEFYWNHIKRKIIPEIVKQMTAPSQDLLPALNTSEEADLLSILSQCGIEFAEPAKKFKQDNIRFKDRSGIMFEKIVAHEFKKVLTDNHLGHFIPHTYLGVKTYALEYDSQNQAKLPLKIQDDKNDDEFDLTMVMPWGTLQIFEAKTFYGQGGDVLKSLRDSARLKSGIFGNAIFIDHILEQLKQEDGAFPDFYPPSLISKRDMIKGMRMKAWGFDQIEKELPKMCNTPKRLFLLFNHTLTPVQETDAKSSLGVQEIIPLPETIRAIWGNIPPELSHIRDHIQSVQTWLKAHSFYGDYVLIQGDFGACYLMVEFCFKNGLIPVYSTTRREALEEIQPDGAVKLTHRFLHQRFRRYGE